MTSFWNLAKSHQCSCQSYNTGVTDRRGWILKGIPTTWTSEGTRDKKSNSSLLSMLYGSRSFLVNLFTPERLKQHWCFRSHSQSAVQEDLIRPCTYSEPSSLYFTGSAAMVLTGALLSDLAELQIWTLFERAHGALATSVFALSSAVSRPPCCAGGESLEHADLNCH